MFVPSQKQGISRRTFLMTAGRLTAASALMALSPRVALEATAEELASPPTPVRGKETLLVRSLNPVNLETPVPLLTSWITPNEAHFVRTHHNVPLIDRGAWTLVIDGEVERPLTLTFTDLKEFTPVAAVRTLECAGNGRSFFNPKTAGTQWTNGAVGTARYEGVRLADVLKRAGVRPSGKHVMFNGADAPALPTAPDFVRSIPLEKALHPDTLLVYTMNGEPLPPMHGYPLRVIPAGWIGAACVKWLVNIRVLREAHDGHFMVKAYRFPRSQVAPGADPDPTQMVPLAELEVRSLITAPLQGATVPTGPLVVKGVAWAGEADIANVEVSVDFGRTWQTARLGAEQERYAWRRWEFQWVAREPGSYLVLARAMDSTGRTQPIEQVWNPSGYLWNVIDRVRVNVLKG